MTQDDTKSPNEKLAGLIIEKLKTENLVPQEKLKEIESKIAFGNSKQEDWRFWVEMNLPEIHGGKDDE